MVKLREIAEGFPGVTVRLFHIPEKGEVREGAYFLNISDDVRQIGIEYVPLLHKCDWQRSWFHKHDAHPNQDGYLNLAQCMAAHIE